MQEFGPLRRLWCMRFEAKHQRLKKLSDVVCNFRNITKTLAERHQLRQCWELNSADIFNDCDEISKSTSQPLRSLHSKVAQILRGNISTHIA